MAAKLRMAIVNHLHKEALGTFCFSEERPEKCARIRPFRPPSTGR
jgi:hypothetical protein